MEENIITITGQARINVVPDVTGIGLRLSSVHDSYVEAYARAKRTSTPIPRS